MTSSKSNADRSGGATLDAATWAAYQAAPNIDALVKLLAAAIPRRELLAELESRFHAEPEWRVAQHLALLHLDLIPPHTGRCDLVLAFYFAHRAVTLSNSDPRARVVMAKVCWERRLPLAVIHEVESILACEPMPVDLTPDKTRALYGEAYEIEGKALAYLGEADAAVEKLARAEELRGGVTLNALLQLLPAARHNAAVHEWAASRIPPHIELGSAATASILRYHQRRLLIVLAARSMGWSCP